MKTQSGVEWSLMSGASLSFSHLGPPASVCTPLICRREGSVHCKFGGCCVCGSGLPSTLSSSSEVMAESGMSGA